MPEKTSGGHFYLSDLSERDKPWDTHRASSDLVRELYQVSEFENYASRIRDCCQRLIFALTAENETEFRFRLKAAHFCRCRHCPVCQWRRSLMWRARFLEAMPKFLADYPKARYIFLTLTVRNCALNELRSTLAWMNKGWERLSQRKVFPGIGWVKSVEVTRNPKDNTAHPHLHILVMVKPSYFTHGYVKQERWRELWQESLRTDYLPVVHVQVVKPRSGISEAPGDGLALAILETLKYGVKETDLVADASWLHELTRQLHKTRSVAVGGVLRQYLQEKEPEDLIAEDESIDSATDEGFLLYFDWANWVKRYVKVDPK